MKGIKYISFNFPINTKYEKYELVLRPRTSYFSLFLASYSYSYFVPAQNFCSYSYSYFVPGTSTRYEYEFWYELRSTALKVHLNPSNSLDILRLSFTAPQAKILTFFEGQWANLFLFWRRRQKFFLFWIFKGLDLAKNPELYSEFTRNWTQAGLDAFRCGPGRVFRAKILKTRKPRKTHLVWDRT